MVNANSIIDYSYEDFCKGIDHIAKLIEASDFNPDYIVGIVRGGAVPAVHLSHKLRIPVVMVAWNTRDSTDWGNESNTWIPEDVNAGKRIIIVDDIVDGGETIDTLLEDWGNSIPEDLISENIRVASMIYNTAQDVNVDFYHQTVDRTQDQRWFHFHWEA
jgi:hypoxanthine phosphoribosyltransferase